MNKTHMMNILMMAGVSAAVHGFAAVLFVPALSFILLAVGAPPAPVKGLVASTDNGMVLAVLFPLFFALIGFVAGAFPALVYTMLTADKGAPRVPVEEPEPVYDADAAIRAAS
jgi:hypothetical protein